MMTGLICKHLSLTLLYEKEGMNTFRNVLANLHIVSPGYHEGTEVSRCIVGSINICISLNPENPNWLFIWGLLHFLGKKEISRGLRKEWLILHPQLSYSKKELFSILEMITF